MVKNEEERAAQWFTMLEREGSTVVYDVECKATEWFIMLNEGLHSGLSC